MDQELYAIFKDGFGLSEAAAKIAARGRDTGAERGAERPARRVVRGAKLRPVREVSADEAPDLVERARRSGLESVALVYDAATGRVYRPKPSDFREAPAPAPNRAPATIELREDARADTRGGFTGASADEEGLPKSIDDADDLGAIFRSWGLSESAARVAAKGRED